jgi:hypothetical protein
VRKFIDRNHQEALGWCQEWGNYCWTEIVQISVSWEEGSEETDLSLVREGVLVSTKKHPVLASEVRLIPSILMTPIRLWNDALFYLPLINPSPFSVFETFFINEYSPFYKSLNKIILLVVWCNLSFIVLLLCLGRSGTLSCLLHLGTGISRTPCAPFLASEWRTWWFKYFLPQNES